MKVVCCTQPTPAMSALSSADLLFGSRIIRCQWQERGPNANRNFVIPTLFCQDVSSWTSFTFFYVIKITILCFFLLFLIKWCVCLCSVIIKFWSKIKGPFLSNINIFILINTESYPLLSHSFYLFISFFLIHCSGLLTKAKLNFKTFWPDSFS